MIAASPHGRFVVVVEKQDQWIVKKGEWAQAGRPSGASRELCAWSWGWDGWRGGLPPIRIDRRIDSP